MLLIPFVDDLVVFKIIYIYESNISFKNSPLFENILSLLDLGMINYLVFKKTIL